MGLWFALLILVVLAAPLARAIWRSNELFCVEVTRGKPRVVRGRCPQRLLDDLADVLGRPRVERARLRVVVEDGLPRLIVALGNLSDAQAQQLRNVLGTYRAQEIRAGRRPR